jgi:CHRD domain
LSVPDITLGRIQDYYHIGKLGCVFAMTAGVLSTVSGAFAQQVTPLLAALNGGNECNGASPPLCRQGDLGGFGSATVIFPTATVVCFGITVSGLSAKPILAHIHSGASGINGGSIVVPFIPPIGGNPGTSSACVSAAAATIAAIRADPAKFYVHVHTTAFPAGAIRGQLQ